METPTVGQWLEQLPGWKKTIFRILTVIAGDLNAIEWVGYHRHIKTLKRP